MYSAFERLLVAEGDRRRVRIELHEPEPEEPSVAVLAIADYKKGLGARRVTGVGWPEGATQTCSRPPFVAAVHSAVSHLGVPLTPDPSPGPGVPLPCPVGPGRGGERHRR
ncbi:phage terminase small subunit [Streptomyces mirabilis]